MHLLTFFLICFALFQTPKLEAKQSLEIKKSYLKIHKNLHLYYGVYAPKEGEYKADIFYYHGFGDSFENHEELFAGFVKKGFRVISFDYPDHGRTLNNFSQSLHFKTLNDVAKLGVEVYKQVITESEKTSAPLYLAGWSTGGLISARIIQDSKFASFSKKIEALILYAPGLNVKLCVGEKLCEVTNETLTHKSLLHDREIKPNFPAKYLLFASSMLYQGHLSKKLSWPSTPTLIFHSSIDDQYVKTTENMDYFNEVSQASIKNIHCPSSYHEMDNELEANGSVEVKASSADYLNSIFNKSEVEFDLSACYEF